MEKEDEQLLDQLKSCGCKLPSDAKTLADVPHNYVLSIAQKCIDTISGNPDTPVPNQKGEQVLLASKIASTCKELGYEDDLGYDLFIYPNENDLRRILLFLVSKINNVDKQSHLFDSNDNTSLLMKRIRTKLKEELNKPWYPLYCLSKPFQVTSDGKWTRDGCCYIEPFHSTPFVVKRDESDVTEAYKKYWFSNVKCTQNINSVPKNHKSEIKEANDILNKLKTNGNFKMKFFDKEYMQEQNFEKLNISDNNKKSELDVDSLDINKLHDKNERQNILKQLLEENENTEIIANVETKLLNDTNDIKENILKLQNEIEEIEKKKPKVEEVDDEYSILEKQLKKKAEKLKRARNAAFIATSPDKERLIHANDVVDTIDHLNKLQMEMGKIISNINSTQKDINRINGVLDRSFVVADDMIFKDAKNDEFARKTYKLVANVHTDCNELSNMVKDIGVFTRDTVALEQNVEAARKKNIEENLCRARNDFHNLSKK